LLPKELSTSVKAEGLRYRSCSRCRSSASCWIHCRTIALSRPTVET